MSNIQTLEVKIQGMDCAECTRHVQHAIAGLPGVETVEVLLASEKAIVRLDPTQVDLPAIRQAVQGAGYSVPEAVSAPARAGEAGGKALARPLLILLGVLFAVILAGVIAGEWLGLFETINAFLPWPAWLAIVVAAGYPVFRNVIQAALKRQVISHTLMSLGVLAAALVGEWATALMVVFFMRVGDYVERFTTERVRQALKHLTAMAPQTARVERDGQEVEIPASEARVGEIVVVRPGEKIPVDGDVISGQATVDQAAITGESLPLEAGPGTHVYAASIALLGSLRVRTVYAGPDTTFGHVIHLVEQAEANKAPVERIADRFSAYYLPVVASVAALTFLISRDPLATAAVLVVACSCAFALATPIAMLASIGAGAQHGLLIKGGKYLELLAKADVLLIDKTGTLTLGKPEITDVGYWSLDFGFSVEPVGRIANPSPPVGWVANPSQPVIQVGDPSQPARPLEIIRLAASAERYSEHPLAEAVRAAASAAGLSLEQPQNFQALPGSGVRAMVAGKSVAVGGWRLAEAIGPAGDSPQPLSLEGVGELAKELEGQGKTVLFVAVDGQVLGLLAAADQLRPEVPQAVAAVRALGVRRIELLTGDNERTAKTLAGPLGVDYRAGLLPQDKIAIVKEYQARGHTVVMVGDGVNDAPALAQADVGIAMGAAGSDVAIDAAGIVLLGEDWGLVPQAIRIARRTLRVVKMNIGFTVLYNLVGLTLAAFGILPPALAAAAQSLPDLLMLGNSARLMKFRSRIG